jgi:hypothetical protein
MEFGILAITATVITGLPPMVSSRLDHRCDPQER